MTTPSIGATAATLDLDFDNGVYTENGSATTVIAAVLDRAGNAQDSDVGIDPTVDANGLVLTSTTQHHLWGTARTRARADGVHVFEFDVSSNSNNAIIFFVGDDAFTDSAAHATLNSDGSWGLYQGPYVGRGSPAVALGTLPTGVVQRVVIGINGTTVKLVANGGTVTTVTQDTGVPEEICFGCSEETGLAQPEGRGKRYFYVPTTTATDAELAAISVVGATSTSGGGATAAPAVGAVAITGNAPTFQTGTIVNPSTGALTVAGQQPTVQTPRIITPSTGAITVTGHAPVPAGGVTVAPAAGALTVTGGVSATPHPGTSPYDGTVWDHGAGSYGTGFSHGTYLSASMGVTVGYTIYLPPGYSSGSDHYPVIYFLHGREGHENADPGHLDWYVNTAGGSVPCIVVFPNGGYDSKYMDPAPGSPMYGVEMAETTVIKELIPLIDATYRTIPDRGHRALQGFSMGGQGVLRLGIKYNHLFSSLYAFSAAVVTYEDTVAANEPALLTAFFNDVPALFGAETAKAQLNFYANQIRTTLPIAFETGADDSFILGWVADFQTAMDAITVPYTAAVITGRGHAYDWSSANVAFALTNFGTAPGSGELVVAGHAPTFVTTSSINPSTGSVVIAGQQPTIQTQPAVTPAAGAILVTGNQPTFRTETRTGSGALNITGNRPTIVVTPAVITPGGGVLVATGHRSTISIGVPPPERPPVLPPAARHDFLPRNATRWERAVSLATDTQAKLGPYAELMRGIKHVSPPNSFLPFLVYEYGLGPITPYFDNLRLAIDEGVAWSRVLGTQAALSRALGWINYAADVEPFPTRRKRWNLFMLAMGGLPAAEERDLIQIEDLARLSAPLRSRFWRGYRTHDIRAGESSYTPWSKVAWSSYSGARIRPSGAKWSFGRDYQTTHTMTSDELTALGVYIAPSGGGGASLTWGSFAWQDAHSPWSAVDEAARISLMISGILSKQAWVVLRDEANAVIGYRRARVQRAVNLSGVGPYRIGVDRYSPAAGAKKIYIEAMTDFGEGFGSTAASWSLLFGATPIDTTKPGLLWAGPGGLAGGTEIVTTNQSITLKRTIRERFRVLLAF